MIGLERTDDVRLIISDIDNLITELLQVRRRVNTLVDNNQSTRTLRSVREAEWFGIWAEREDMCNLSSREWLTQLRAQQWEG